MGRTRDRDAARVGTLDHLAAIVSSSDDAILSKDRDAVITSWNAAAQRLYGYTAEEAIGQPISILIPPERAGEEREILARILAGERVDHYETVRVTKDGDRVHVSLAVSPIHEDEGIVGAAVIARDITERRRAAERSQRLQRLTASLSAELTPQAALEALLRDAHSALEADAATVGLLSDDGQRIELTGSVGYSEHIRDWDSFPVAADLPLSEAVRTQEPIWSSSSGDLIARYPALAATDVRFEALAAVPLVVAGRSLGAVALSFARSREFGPEERAFVTAAAQQAAQAIARASLYEAERRARERLAFLADASDLLSQSLDVDETLRRLATLAVPRLGDWCSVHLAEPEGELRTVAVAHTDPRKVELARDLQERYPPDPAAATGAPQVIRTGEPELYAQISDELLVEVARDEEHLRLIRELGLRSAIVAPLRGRERTLGALTLVAAESGRRYDEDDVTLTKEVARRAALAVDNALLYRAEHEAAVTLQRALLPESLPEVSRVDIAARYLPAGIGLEVGGDWYDVLETGADTLTLIVGDVAGSGVHAASVMGQLRTGLRALALERHPPAVALERLDTLMKGFPEPQMATVLQVAVDLGARSIEFARAGHPPAMLRKPSGQVVQLREGGSRPIGLLADPRCQSCFAALEAGSTLLLYTDGLVERRGRGIDAGLERLADVFARSPTGSEACIDAIVGELLDGDPDDDVAVLAMRT